MYRYHQTHSMKPDTQTRLRDQRDARAISLVSVGRSASLRQLNSTAEKRDNTATQLFHSVDARMVQQTWTLSGRKSRIKNHTINSREAERKVLEKIWYPFIIILNTLGAERWTTNIMKATHKKVASYLMGEHKNTAFKLRKRAIVLHIQYNIRSFRQSNQAGEMVEMQIRKGWC